MNAQEYKAKLLEIIKKNGDDHEVANWEAKQLTFKVMKQLGYGDGIEVHETIPNW